MAQLFSQIQSEYQWISTRELDIQTLNDNIKYENSLAWKRASQEMAGVLTGVMAAGFASITAPTLSLTAPLLTSAFCGTVYTAFQAYANRKELEDATDEKRSLIINIVDRAKQLEVLQETGILSFAEVPTLRGLWPVSPCQYLTPQCNKPSEPTNSNDLWGGDSRTLRDRLTLKRKELSALLKRKGGDIYYNPFETKPFLLYLSSLEQSRHIRFTPGRSPFRERGSKLSPMTRYELSALFR